MRWDTFPIFPDFLRSKVLSRSVTCDTTRIYHVDQYIIAHAFTGGEKKVSHNIEKSQNIMKLVACRIFFCFYMFLLTNNFVKNSHIEATIFLFFLKSVPNKNRNFLHTKFRRQWKDRKSSYQVREALPSFSSELLTLC